MSKKAPRCDACGEGIRPSQHELRLSDLGTGQHIGRYHAPRCQAAAVKYIMDGAALRLAYAHPTRCGPNQEFCDGGVFKVA